MDTNSVFQGNSDFEPASRNLKRSYRYTSSTDLPKLQPENLLALAIIGDAVWCLQRSNTKVNGKRVAARIRLKQEADQYIRGESNLEYPQYSFDNICMSINLDPDAVRKRIYERLGSGDHFDMRELVFWLR